MAVVIKADGEDAWVDGLAGLDPETAALDDLKAKIRDGGCCGMGGAAFPTHVKLSPPDGKKIDILLLNGVECEPFLTADHRLMLEQSDRMIDGIKLVMKVLGVNRAVIGIEENKMDAIDMLSKKLAGSNIGVTALELRYPQGCEKRLIDAETGRKVPAGGLPMDVGVVVQNVGTVASVSDAIRKGLPFIERVMTISGPIVKQPKNLLVRIGTPISHLLAQCGGTTEDIAKIIHGGPMMGNAVPSTDAAVVRGTSGVLFFGKGMVPERPIGPCIRCLSGQVDADLDLRGHLQRSCR
jgi:electron transport complex protein RnfC